MFLSPEKNVGLMELKHPNDVQAIARANQDFTSRLYPILVNEQGHGENLVMSSYSLISVLAMLLVGARGNTQNQIRSGLAMPDEEEIMLRGFESALTALRSNENFTLDAANRLYVQSGFDLAGSFLDLTQEYFHAMAENIDFSESENARMTINDWVEEITRDKIKQVIPSGLLNAMTRLVLVNAIYFKGSWADKFEKESTRQADFQVSLNERIRVAMMHKKGDYFLQPIDELDARVLTMPYKGDRLSMMLFLPNKPEDFTAMEEKFSNFDFASIKPKFKVEVDVAIPKFKIETTHNLVDPLKSLGMTDMFSTEDSDFSRMTEESNNLFVSSILQKAFIEVNEEGTEAAAATVAIVGLTSIQNTPEFICNRPFLFAIRDNLTGLVLFQGRVVRPSTE